MQPIDATTLRSRRDREVAINTLGTRQFRTRGPKQREPCWTLHDKMAMLDTVVRGFTCGPIYIIENLEEEIDDVFDGAHRCEAIFEFIDGAFAITKGKSDEIKWETSPLNAHIGKKFEELPKELKEKFRKYPFSINVVDPDTANDPEALGMLWRRLSKAGKPLNRFETKKQTHALFYRLVLDPMTADWLSSPLVPKEEGKRGDVQSKLNRLLAISEFDDIPPAMNSMDDLVDKWCDTVLGKTTAEIDANAAAKAEDLTARLKAARSLLRELEDRKVFLGDAGESLIDKSRDLPILIALSRLVKWFPSVAKFKRVEKDVCEIIRGNLILNPNQRCEKLGVTSRNAAYQKALIKYFDDQFKPLSAFSSERRLFTAAERSKKLEEQGGLCAACKEPILPSQRSEADHIVEYSRGGATTLENCQVLHKTCHERKNQREA